MSLTAILRPIDSHLDKVDQHPSFKTFIQSLFDNRIKDAIVEANSESINASDIRKSTKFADLGVSVESMRPKFEVILESEISDDDLRDIATIGDLIDSKTIDPVWKDERNNRIKNINDIIKYFQYRVSYYKKNKDSRQAFLNQELGSDNDTLRERLVEALNEEGVPLQSTDVLDRALRRVGRTLKRDEVDSLKEPASKKKKSKESRTDQALNALSKTAKIFRRSMHISSIESSWSPSCCVILSSFFHFHFV